MPYAQSAIPHEIHEKNRVGSLRALCEPAQCAERRSFAKMTPIYGKTTLLALLALTAAAAAVDVSFPGFDGTGTTFALPAGVPAAAPESAVAPALAAPATDVEHNAFRLQVSMRAMRMCSHMFANTRKLQLRTRCVSPRVSLRVLRPRAPRWCTMHGRRART